MSTKSEGIYKIFDSDGLLSQSIENFEYREDQLNMAQDVLSCYEEPSLACIEAGTGIGKSIAYLAPALFYAFENPEDRTVVATSTINLQKQLMEKDLPALFKVFGKECNVALAVGRQNYVCKRRLENEMRAIPLLAEAGLTEIAKINEFANNTETGLRTDYPGRLDFNAWSSVCSDSDFCMGPKCPFFSECFYYKAKKKLSEASIIICNHHLLFVDSNSRMESGIDYSEDCLLPSFQRLVIDEAHNIERHATDLFTTESSSFLLRRQMDYIYDPKSRFSQGVKMLDEFVPYCSDKKLYDEIINDFALVNSKSDTLNMIVLNFMDTNSFVHLLITQSNAQRVLDQFIPYAISLIDNVMHLVNLLTTFSSKLVVDDSYKSRVDELNIHIGRIHDAALTLKGFVNYTDWNDDIHYIETEKRAGTRFAVFKVAPLDVAPVLREALFKKVDSVVCTSATLDLKDGFEYFNNSVGLNGCGKKLLKKVYSSPFDYKNRLMLLTPYDAPDFNNEKQQEYADFLIESIYDAVASSGGGALILFTSIRLMDYVYQNLYPRFSSLELTCLKQGDADRYALLEQFKNDTDSVLFATDSFWEGVDAPGNTLRLVIITKLPFRMPDEPIYRARYTKLEREGKSGFYCLSLPDAAMKLKQGYGRLMRHTQDKGIVLIVDSRIVSKSYGAMMLSSLPDSYHPETSVSTVGQKIESFLF